MTTLALISILVAAAALFSWISARVLRLPSTIGTMLLTVGASLTLILLSARFPALHAGAVDLVSRIHFEALILHGMLALLLFAGACLLNLDDLVKERLPVAVLSIFGTVLSTLGVAALLHFALGFTALHPGWLECLFFGALISPTDPIAVLEMLHRTGVSRNIQAQLAGESLFNDGVGAVLFLGVLQAARGHAPSLPHLALNLVIQSGGGLLLGIALARLTSELMRRVDSFTIDLLHSLALALGGYALAEALHVSAPLEAVAAGLAIRHFNHRHPAELIAHAELERFWRALDEVQNAVLFVLLGLEVLAVRFTLPSLAAGGLAVIIVNGVRFAVVAALLGLLACRRNHRPSSVTTLTWGGLRGGLSIALALAVPPTFGHDWLLATTYAVVVFSIVVQGGTLDIFLKRRNAAKAQTPQLT